MKSILCATDFSENAFSAMQYAANLAEELNVNLVLFHAYHNQGPIVSSHEVVTKQPLGTDHRPLALEKMKELIETQQALRPKPGNGISA